MDNKLILVGGGGHCKACMEVIEASGEYSIKGIIDSQLQPGTQLMEYPVLGDDKLISTYAKEPGINFLITVGQIHSPSTRISLVERIRQAGGKLATVIAPSAIVSKASWQGEGTIVMHQVILNNNSRIGVCAILNNKSLVEHDCVIGDFCHISTGAIVNGNCMIGDRVFVGSGAVLANGIQIAADTIIGAGAAVLRSITEPGVYLGNPARKIPGKNA